MMAIFRSSKTLVNESNIYITSRPGKYEIYDYEYQKRVFYENCKQYASLEWRHLITPWDNLQNDYNRNNNLESSSPVNFKLAIRQHSPCLRVMLAQQMYNIVK